MKHFILRFVVVIMRHLLAIYFVVFSLVGYGQPPVGRNEGHSDPAKIISFIDSNLGKKVGDGVCIDLPIEAFGMSHERMQEFCDYVDRGEFDSYCIAKKHIRAGDVIDFYDAVDKRGHVIAGHIAIVYKILNDSTIIIAEQNCGRGREKIVKCGKKIVPVLIDSKVELSYFRFNNYWNKEFSEGHIRFCRL